MTPMGDPELKPREGGELNLDFVFQPRVYACSCGNHLRVEHAVLLGIYGFTGAFFAFMGFTHRGTSGGLTSFTVGVGALAYFVFKVAQRLRFPRVY